MDFEDKLIDKVEELIKIEMSIDKKLDFILNNFEILNTYQFESTKHFKTIDKNFQFYFDDKMKNSKEYYKKDSMNIDFMSIVKDKNKLKIKKNN